MDSLADKSLWAPLFAGTIFITIGVLPVNKINIAGTEALLGKPLRFWQRFIFTSLGILFLALSLLPGNGIIPSKPSMIQFSGIACKPYQQYLRLSEERIFLRTPEFNKLGLPLGISVNLQIVDGTNNSVNLILDNDKEIIKCSFLINKKTRTILGIDSDVDQELSARSWIIKG